MQLICRTCFRQISDGTSVAQDFDHYKYQLTLCVPEIDLRVLPEANLCNDCVVALDITYKFKIKCREVENEINKQRFNVDERLTIKQEINSDNGSNYVVCRICFADSKRGSSSLTDRSFYKRKLIFCVPEMYLRIVSDSRLCEACRTTVDTFYMFKIKCLDVEKTIKEYIKLYDIVDYKDLFKWRNTFIKTEVGDFENIMIKQEEVKLEDIREDSVEQIENVAFVTVKTEELKACDCTIKETAKYRKRKSKNEICDNVERLSNKSINKTSQNNGRIGTFAKRQFKCFRCEYSAAKKAALVLHIRRHTNEKPFKCTQCEYGAARKFDLVNHVRKHSGEKPFKCTRCTYSAADKSTLNRHSRTHTGKKPFKCPHCEYGASRKSHLKVHIRTHTGDKPFKCFRCEYSAADKCSMGQHVRTHTGEKPFKCPHCVYSAVRKFNLNEHIRVHTGDHRFKCALCPYGSAKKSYLISHIQKRKCADVSVKVSAV